MRDPRLTLKLSPEGHYVDLDTFVDALASFRRMLNGLRDVSTEEGRPLEWLVTDLQVGSAVAAVEPKGDVHTGIQAAEIVLEGLEALEKDEVPPVSFTQDAIAAAKTLVDITIRAKVRPTIAGLERRLEITHKTAATAAQLLDVVVWEDLGTIEGSLEMVNVHDRYLCNIYEALNGRRVPCHFHRSHLDTVRSALGWRVLVTGWVRYNRHGQVLSIRAEEFVPISETENLPTIDDMAGIAPDITGGLSVEEYIRRLRDEQ